MDTMTRRFARLLAAAIATTLFAHAGQSAAEQGAAAAPSVSASAVAARLSSHSSISGPTIVGAMAVLWNSRKVARNLISPKNQIVHNVRP